MKKIALVHDWLTGMRGGEKCLEVFCELFPDADLYTLFYIPDRVSPVIRAMNIRASWLNRLPGVERYYRYALPLFPTAAESFALRDYDLVLSSSHCVAKGVCVDRALHLSYIHSPMRYIWDQYDAYFGADGPWPSRAAMAFCRSYLQQWDLRSADRVNCFIANSKNVAAKIKMLYGREAAVIHPPVDVERFELSERQEPYYLIVSALVPYKKIDIAIAAFNRLKLPLKIAGEGPLRKRLEKLAQPNIEFLGWVSDEAIATLYASCQALIFPGEEDFGIVPLEAQASGRPVIAYGKGGVRESVIDIDGLDRGGADNATGIFYTEASTESLIDAVERYHEIKHLFEPAALRRHASRFSRAAFKSQMKQFIAEKLREHSGLLPKDVKTA
jgi:glycosyltransferase involved in cell wall biosynthesis